MREEDAARLADAPSEPLSWLVDYVAEHGTLEDLAVEEFLEENYVAIGLLDSLGVVQMLVGVEEEFGVWLSSEEMQDPRFCSIAGLAELVEASRTRAV
jgi:acyl carrier protein